MSTKQAEKKTDKDIGKKKELITEKSKSTAAKGKDIKKPETAAKKPEKEKDTKKKFDKK